MKTLTNTINLDKLKNFVFTLQLVLAMLAFPVLFVVELTHKDEVAVNTKPTSKESQKVVAYRSVEVVGNKN